MRVMGDWLRFVTNMPPMRLSGDEASIASCEASTHLKAVAMCAGRFEHFGTHSLLSPSSSTQYTKLGDRQAPKKGERSHIVKGD